MRAWYFQELGAKAPHVLDVSGSTLKRGMIKEVSREAQWDDILVVANTKYYFS